MADDPKRAPPPLIPIVRPLPSAATRERWPVLTKRRTNYFAKVRLR